MNIVFHKLADMDKIQVVFFGP